MDKPIRDDIVILPARPRTLSLGWNIYTFTDEEEHQDFILKNDGEEALKSYLYNNHPDRQTEVDLADIYYSTCGVAFKEPDAVGYDVVEVLPELKGEPWNNEAVNRLVCVRPSSVRVTESSVTCDWRVWRVTVYLEKDGVTIKKIVQEVRIGKHGHGFNEDVSSFHKSEV